LAAPVATAQSTCLFDEPTGVLQVSLVGSAPSVIARETDAITLDAVACGTATVANTEMILVTGTGQGQPDDLTLDLAGGPFAPGRSPETDGGDPEIEIVVDLPGGGSLTIAGDANDDVITLGGAGANLNVGEAVGDVDVALTGGAFVLAGHEGSDTLSLAGGDGIGGPAAAATVEGGVGDDTVAGAGGGSTLDGGEGIDTVDYSAATAVWADLSSGIGLPAAGDQPDTLVGFENVIGSPGDDRLVGNGGGNLLASGVGDDALEGRAGDDVLNGGEGQDVLDLSAGKPVEVDLVEGTADGQGTDTLSGIENLIGSNHEDVLLGNAENNVLRGGGGADEIRGNAGRDQITGELGNDLLYGGTDADTLDGGRGRDQLDGGDGRDTCIPGPDSDSWTGCERVRL
ncbi:MAG: calcium-binding protein, partial [Actinomycetota bacterium]